MCLEQAIAVAQDFASMKRDAVAEKKQTKRAKLGPSTSEQASAVPAPILDLAQCIAGNDKSKHDKAVSKLANTDSITIDDDESSDNECESHSARSLDEQIDILKTAIKKLTAELKVLEDIKVGSDLVLQTLAALPLNNDQLMAILPGLHKQLHNTK